MRLYPPYLGAGVRVEQLEQPRGFLVSMPLTPLNRNIVGTHFGGSLYSMCDPFLMLILLQALGRDYIVWDKAASIRFRRPGTGTVTCRITIDDDTIDRIRRDADTLPSVEPTFTLHIRDEQDAVVAEIEKLLYVRRKNRDAADH
ncbi:MAG: DUF4442 domain-containing protein [Deltaproteobacteria bacterium]|nr:MAG: DUF4442 domain-containing protein [Deltaproteobacteria bacterium]